MRSKILVAILSVLTVLVITTSGCTQKETTPNEFTSVTGTTKNNYSNQTSASGTTAFTMAATYATTYTTTVAGATQYQVASPTNTTLGLATGGAKDISNFRQNIQNNYLPLPTDVTYEGLFYDYYFDTGKDEVSDKLFSPSYSYAVTRDPLSSQPEYYLSVGLNSGLKESDFQRKDLNLVIVMDVSGSMASSYNRYYYDADGRQIDAYEGEGIYLQSKVDSSKQAVISILDQLTPNDRFAIVLFNDAASVWQRMIAVKNINIESVKNHVLNIGSAGSTNMAAGLTAAAREFHGLSELNSYQYENRIIILTDAEPNTGFISGSDFTNIVENNAAQRIYTTFIGVGVDFNSQLIESISKVKGANYYTARSPREFRERILDEFDYMVTPLVFNVQLNFESSGWRIEKVFGSPEANAATGNLLKINTLFPSKSVGGQTKGGLVLLKLRPVSSRTGDLVYLRTTYEDRNGRRDGGEAVIRLDARSPEFFDNNGIRKGILLTRYAALLKNWMIEERSHVGWSNLWDPAVREDTGIMIPDENIGQWERTSLHLSVSSPYRNLFTNFRRYFEQEMRAIGDTSLDQEVDVLNYLAY